MSTKAQKSYEHLFISYDTFREGALTGLMTLTFDLLT